MKHNLKNKIVVSDSNPVMNCRAIRRRKMGSDPQAEAWGVGVTLVPQEKLDMEKMGAMSQ